MRQENRERIAEILREAENLATMELRELTTRKATGFDSLTAIVNEKLDLGHLLSHIREARRFI